MHTMMWLGGRVDRVLRLRSVGLQSNPGRTAAECNPGQVVHSHDASASHHRHHSGICSARFTKLANGALQLFV